MQNLKRFNNLQIFLFISFLIIISIIVLIFIPFLFLLLLFIQPFLKKYYKNKYNIQSTFTETFTIMTEDGFRISIFRNKPKKLKSNSFPVILCHGIITNYSFMDMDRKHSLAKFLEEEGYDVFNISLRGTFPSQHPKGEVDFSVDDMIGDIKQIVDKICELTNKNQVHWVGHSMGAMIMYSHLAICTKVDSNKIKSFVSLGGPGTLHNIHPTFAKLGLKYISFLKKIDIIKFAKIFIPLINILPKSFHEYSYTPGLTEKSVIKKTLFALENISQKMIIQFLQSVLLGGFIHSLDKKINYSEKFSKITCPILFITGNYDIVVPIHSSKFVFDKVSSKNKNFITLSKENSAGNYGHACLVLGENASKEVFPIIFEFIKSNEQKKTRP